MYLSVCMSIPTSLEASCLTRDSHIGVFMSPLTLLSPRPASHRGKPLSVWFCRQKTCCGLSIR